MANSDGTKVAAMKDRLLSQGERFSFFQAYRLLRLLTLAQGDGQAEINVRPNINLHFPGTDLSNIRETDAGKYRLTANFLGLYGVTSPLPNFYSEDLLDEFHEGRHSNRDFLDIISQTIYPLFFRAWLKSRAHIRIKEFDDKRLLEIFHTFVGINQPLKHLNRPGFEHLLRFAGLFSQLPRSAMGLQTIIAALYPATRVEIVQQDERWQPIPVDQQCHLGIQAHQLGEDAHLGVAIRSRSSNLTIRIHDVDQTLFLTLLPGESEFKKLEFIVRYYLLDPVDVRIELKLKAGAVQPMQLGQTHWTGLGRDSWLVHSGTDHQASLAYSL